tara:strand:- start:1007 stop:1396 length:390 start_codon:yes stop_codon:yes gene_type:complete
MDKVKSDALRSTYKSKAEAEKAGMAMGLEGTHTHTNEAGETVYMPGKNHEEFMKAQEDKKDGKKVKTKYQAARDEMYKKRLKDMGSYRKYADGKKKADFHGKNKKKKSPYADGVASDAGTVGRELDGVL